MIRNPIVVWLVSGVVLGLGLMVYTGQAVEVQPGGMEVIVCNPLLGQVNSENSWEAAKAIGVKGFELNAGSDLVCSSVFVNGKTPYRLDTPENAAKILTDAQAQGLVTPVICAGIQLQLGEKPAAPAWARKLIENAPRAGVDLIYFPLSFGRSASPDNVQPNVDHAIAVLKELTAHGKQHGVAVCIENLQHYWNRPDYLRPVLKAFAPDEFNLCLDPINLYWYGYPRAQVYEYVTEYIPRARHFHVKNVAHPEDQREVQREPGWEYGKNSVPAAEGDLDFKRILAELHKAGYKGYVSIEDDSLGHFPKEKRPDVLRQDVEYLRGIIAGL
ncbi:MAG: sugar phosphate isomerase/epimerase family protein [bacterium]